MPEEKRAIVNLTLEQYEVIKAAASKLGLTVPGYCRVAALEKASK
jgi:transposase-like protein